MNASKIIDKFLKVKDHMSKNLLYFYFKLKCSCV